MLRVWVSSVQAADRSTHEREVRRKPCRRRRSTLFLARIRQQESEFLDRLRSSSSSCRNWEAAPPDSANNAGCPKNVPICGRLYNYMNLFVKKCNYYNSEWILVIRQDLTTLKPISKLEVFTVNIQWWGWCVFGLCGEINLTQHWSFFYFRTVTL